MLLYSLKGKNTTGKRCAGRNQEVIVKGGVFDCFKCGRVLLIILVGTAGRDKIRETTTMFIIFWDVMIDEKIFFSSQVRRNVIISNKHGIYQLPHELLNTLRLTILGIIRKYKENSKISKNYSLVPSLPPKMKIVSILANKCWKKEIELFSYYAVSHNN